MKIHRSVPIEQQVVTSTSTGVGGLTTGLTILTGFVPVPLAPQTQVCLCLIPYYFVAG